jgi:hemerythrin-like domain-containing protein
MWHSPDREKRRLLGAAGASGLVLLGAGLLRPPDPAFAAQRKQPARSKDDKKSQTKDKEEEVTPPEDLMREHGVLDRVLLIYEAGMAKFSANEDFDPAILTRAAEIVRDFIENYHEKSEEEQVFPRFRQAGKMVGLVDTLLAQHEAGRRVTATILRSAPGSRKDGDDRRRLVTAMQSFIVMYRPHAAREDTDLFPKLRGLVSANEYDAMGEDFEKKEHELFGEDGFEKMVDRVAQLEQAIGIHDLKQFTPR